jgi:hypothetical protein
LGTAPITVHKDSSQQHASLGKAAFTGRVRSNWKREKSTLKASTFHDLVAQLDEIKTITVAGGLDEALSACANAVRSNFKTAKDKKPGKG